MLGVPVDTFSPRSPLAGDIYYMAVVFAHVFPVPYGYIRLLNFPFFLAFLRGFVASPFRDYEEPHLGLIYLIKSVD